MEGETWKLWGKAFLDYSKAIGTKVAEGAVVVGQKAKEGAIYVAEKTKEGATYVAEQSKPATDKIKEGAYYIAEKSKPLTDKIKEGSIYVGNQVKTAYIDVKAKVTGKPPEQEGLNQQGQQDEYNNEIQNIQENQENQDNRPLIDFDTYPNEPPINAEHLDDFPNVNGDDPNNLYYPNF